MLNVKQCKMSHDSCRNTQKFKFVGQNLAARYSSAAFTSVDEMIVKSVESWYSEVAGASQSSIDKCCSLRIGHFTQIIQDHAVAIGCAISRYTDGNFKISLIACNYSHGNSNGRPVYETGVAASKCIAGRNPKYPALCSNKEPTRQTQVEKKAKKVKSPKHALQVVSKLFPVRFRRMCHEAKL